MDLRKQKGLQIARTATIQEGIDGWVVPSQTSNRNYFVRKDEDKSCSCPDCRKRGVKCKHAYAVEYYLQKVTTMEDGKIEIQAKRLTYPQAWAAYNKSQETEKATLMELLKDLLENVEEPFLEKNVSLFQIQPRGVYGALSFAKQCGKHLQHGKIKVWGFAEKQVQDSAD